MPGDIVVVKDLRIRRSDVAKVLKYMRDLRKFDSGLRKIMVEMKDSDRLLKKMTGHSMYDELIKGIEEEIASIEKEREGLQRALEKVMEGQTRG